MGVYYYPFIKNILFSLCFHLPFNPPVITLCCEICSYNGQIQPAWCHLSDNSWLTEPFRIKCVCTSDLQHLPVRFQTPPFTNSDGHSPCPVVWPLGLWGNSVQHWRNRGTPFSSLRLNVMASESHLPPWSINLCLCSSPVMQDGSERDHTCHLCASPKWAPGWFHRGISSSQASYWNKADSSDVCSVH